MIAELRHFYRQAPRRIQLCLQVVIPACTGAFFCAVTLPVYRLYPPLGLAFACVVLVAYAIAMWRAVPMWRYTSERLAELRRQDDEVSPPAA